MIPLGYLREWTARAPWPDLRQVEQDLIISRVLCDLFTSSPLRDKIAFRGGTAIHKLLFANPLRYSEDIDLVQTRAEPIGGVLDGIRGALAWLGNCRRDQSSHSTHLVFRFVPETGDGRPLKLKIEINTREHQAHLGWKSYPFAIDSAWFQAAVEIVSFEPEELFGTKLRAMLQRNKNRDLFDLHEGLRQLHLDHDALLACFAHYLALDRRPISRANAEQRMLEKLSRRLSEDVLPLLPAGVNFTDDIANEAFARVWSELIVRIPGEPWKSSTAVISAIRNARLRMLLDGTANEPPL